MRKLLAILIAVAVLTGCPGTRGEFEFENPPTQPSSTTMNDTQITEERALVARILRFALAPVGEDRLEASVPGLEGERSVLDHLTALLLRNVPAALEEKLLELDRKLGSQVTAGDQLGALRVAIQDFEALTKKGLLDLNERLAELDARVSALEAAPNAAPAT